jgi:hypothetical protein
VKKIIIALSALALAAFLAACGDTPPPATNAQAWAAGYKYGDTPAALDGFIGMVGDGASMSTSSLKLYCQMDELTKGGMPRKWMGHGQVSVTLGNEWQLGCADGIGAEAKASTP